MEKSLLLFNLKFNCLIFVLPI